MSRFRPSLALITLAATAAAAAPARARADAGLQVGARGGVQLRADDAGFVGADARLTFDLSPLTVALTFDRYFVPEGETLFQVGATALYELPLASSSFLPYGGIGMSVTRFALPEVPGSVDSNGMRIGLNLVGGVRFEHARLPVARPFAQVMATVGPIDLFTVGGGVLFEVWGG